jgi:aminomuconate-semialdehyde/2-hydroxymuconate-6-semialdehyde dehydrogenase
MAADLDKLDLFIGGEYVPAQSGKRFDDVDPARGSVFAQVALAGRDDVDRAVSAAKKALRGPWGRMGYGERADLLERVAARITERFDDFLAAEIRDTGKPRASAAAIDIPRGGANFRIFAQMLRAYGTDAFEQPTADGAGALHYVQRTPLGVVGVICPWNLPLLLMTWKVAPALAAGNTVVVKPSEETPGTATLLGEVMNEVGVPPGVYNVVHGFGPGSAGEALVKHPDVAAITFTGESRTGQAIMKDASAHVKALSFELGGKNPAIVFADADLDKAIAGTLRSTFLNCGQVCLCSERVYVERSIFEPFVEGMKKGAEALVAGDPYGDGTTLGPLISDEHRQKVTGYFDVAREEGAEIVTGGGTPALDGPFAEGFYVQPTIWTGLPDDARVVREEVFGPVCHIAPFDDEDEAIARANDTEYGLCAAVWTEGLSRAHRVSQALDTGLVWVNTWYLRDLRTPFGGVGQSGIGREGGRHSLEFYSELKNITVKL